MKKFEYLRLLRQKHGEIADKLISYWGTSDFNPFINRLLRETSADQTSNADAGFIEALNLLKQEHDGEFPGKADDYVAQVPEELSLNAHFQIVNAQFPHIGLRLAATWGQHAFSEYVNELFNDTRQGKRKGFPPDITSALWHLMQDHDTAHPDRKLRVSDIWSINEID